MAKTKKEPKWKSEYKKVRKNLLQNVRRLVERGYDVSKIKIPEIPEKITKRAVATLQNINARRYELASHETEVIKNKGKKNERIETVKVKGTQYQKVERKISAEKGKATRRENEIKKRAKLNVITPAAIETPKTEPIITSYDDPDPWYMESEAYNDYQYNLLLNGVISYSEYKLRTGETILSYERELEAKKRVKLVDIETGEVIEGPAGVTTYQGRNVKELKEFQMEYAQKQYDIAKRNLEIMSSYEGRDKHAKITRFNADSISAFLDAEMAKDPARTAAKLQAFNESGAFESVDYMYREGGYARFIYEWAEALDYPSFYGDIEDDEYEDYDE